MNKFAANEGFKSMLMHLSWGDLGNSKFIISEITEMIKAKKNSLTDIDNYLSVLDKLLRLKDSEQMERIRALFNFDGITLYSFPNYLKQYRDFYKLFVLKCLYFVTELAPEPTMNDFLLNNQDVSILF